MNAWAPEEKSGMLGFQNQESRQTLAQGIEEYLNSNPDLAQKRPMSPEAQQFFRCHDVAHVVFGCGTDLDDEAAVKIASIFGTTAGFGVLKGYRLHESLQIYARLRIAEVVRSIARSVWIVPRALARCNSQRARWPWSDHAQFLHTSLHELRQDFGIRVAHHHVQNSSRKESG